MTKTLEALKAAKDLAHTRFTRTISNLFPGADEWTWYRAIDHMEGGDCRRNDDTSRDEAMAASMAIHAAYDDYIRAVGEYHELYDTQEYKRQMMSAFYGKEA